MFGRLDVEPYGKLDAGTHKWLGYGRSSLHLGRRGDSVEGVVGYIVLGGPQSSTADALSSTERTCTSTVSKTSKCACTAQRRLLP